MLSVSPTRFSVVRIFTPIIASSLKDRLCATAPLCALRLRRWKVVTTSRTAEPSSPAALCMRCCFRYFNSSAFLLRCVMNPEKEAQEKTLAKLQWLNERSKVDFRGNPPPFETKKTLRSVEQAKRAKARTLAGESDFLPFWHGTTPLALDATRSNYIQVDQGSKSYSRGSSRATYGAQAIDPSTGLTEVQLALSWSVPHPAVSQPHSYAEMSTDGAPSRVRCDALYLQSLSPQERATAYRTHMLEHPKCTPDSSRVHHSRWAASTQLSAPIVKLPLQRPQNSALQRRNSVRVVHLLHSS
ncbi:conserved hypothetical protein [Leishmania braziliensis MHOM/BR/75/M2904]|uniref:Uncharacterized protein n=3 Tax=Viannia TaxID=37616 RepID=A4H8C3_LEIBR|nr:conserved hypothetical protein [Leishmania braziliensis MHOM/BR/75/M2904]CAJ2469495.1 unnamed protein product [Leishmania braziliensis]CAJ2470017.1 unnamed protein product [Leishmania braziliensis]CAM42172.1 conserved hypothetical protein [Leishmania braziliensis MHOM/BR/75/M2904]